MSGYSHATPTEADLQQVNRSGIARFGLQAAESPAHGELPVRRRPDRSTTLGTVVLPVYNESGLIERTFAAVLAFSLEHPAYRFIFVDDGSTDSTPLLLSKLIDRSGTRAIELIASTPNRGKGHAVKLGINAASGAFVLFTDADLAYSLDHLPRLVRELETADVVIGNRNLVLHAERNSTLRRRLMGWVFNRCARFVLGLHFTDTQAGLKGFRLDAARQIFALEHLGGFAFDVELVYIARRLGFRIAEIPASVSEDHSYKVSKVHLLRDPLRMFGALIDVRLSAWRGRYSQPPRTPRTPRTSRTAQVPPSDHAHL